MHCTNIAADSGHESNALSMTIGAPVWKPGMFNVLEHRGDAQTVEKLGDMRRRVWKLRTQRKSQQQMLQTARFDEEDDEYKGAGENSVAKFPMIKIMFDAFFTLHGKFAVVHVAYDKYWDNPGVGLPAPYQKSFTWTNPELFKSMRVGFMIVNEQHVMNIRWRGSNEIVLRETQTNEDTKSFRNFLAARQVFGPNRIITVDPATPQQFNGGCNTMAMANALLPDDQYASIVDGNEMKIPLVEMIYKQMLHTGQSPAAMAGDGWRHWALHINAPWDSSPEVLKHKDSDYFLDLVEFGSEHDPNPQNQAMRDNYYPPEEENNKREENSRIQNERLAASELKWVIRRRMQIERHNAEGWQSIPSTSRYAKDMRAQYLAAEEDGEDHPDSHNPGITYAEHDAWVESMFHERDDRDGDIYSSFQMDS
jgi:hypothetical protein